MFLLRRPGLLVLGGRVLKKEEDVVTMCCDVELPLSKKSTEIIISTEFGEGKLDNLSLSEGANICVLTSDALFFELLEEGVEGETDELYLYGKNIRFNGCFDFDPYNGLPEQHVFVGQVESVEAFEAKQVQYQKVLVTWNRKRHNHQESQSRTIVCRADKNIKKGSNIAAVCGARKSTKSGTDYYVAKKIYCPTGAERSYIC